MSLSQHARAKKMVVYEAPSHPVAYAAWRAQMWAESTFALSMMERWEKVLICTVVFALTTLFLTGLVQYLPQHLRFIARRAAYYLFGREAELSELLADGKSVLGRGEL